MSRFRSRNAAGNISHRRDAAGRWTYNGGKKGGFGRNILKAAAKGAAAGLVGGLIAVGTGNVGAGQAAARGIMIGDAVRQDNINGRKLRR